MFKTFLARKFFSLLLSSTLGLLVISVLVLSDSIIAGVLLNEDAVAAICLVTPAYSFAAFAGCMISLGVPILFNRAMGEFNKDKADRCFAFGFTTTLVLGAFLFALCALFGDVYLQFYEPTQAVLELAKNYFFWYKFTILLLPLSTLMLEMILADGDETLSMVAGITQIVLNIVASSVLAHFMGIAGIGLGSLVGIAIALLISFAHFFKSGNSLKIGFCFSFKWLVHVCKYSAIDAGTYLYIAGFMLVMNRFITYAYGPEMLVLGVAIVFLRDIQILFDGVGEAFTPLMNIYLGEESYDAVKKCFSLSQKTAVVEGIVLTILMIIFAPLVVQLYDIKDPVISSFAIKGVSIGALGLTFLSLLYLLTSYFLLVNRIKLGFVLSGMRDLFVAAPISILLGHFYGIYGMFAGIAISPALTFGISVIYIRCKYGKENYPLMLADKLQNFKHVFFEFSLSPQNIIGVQKQIETFLVKNGIEKKVISKVKLLIEELYMLVYEKNGSHKEIFAECTLILRESGVQIITKDDGILFDLSREDVLASSITEFMVSGYMEKLKNDKMYLTTMSYNRNAFKVNFGA